MATTLSPLPILGFRDNNGNALVNGQLFTYQAGTQTPAPTYTDSTGVTQNPNPVILNARGEAQVWIPPNTAYKYVLADSFGNTIWTVDQIVNPQIVTLFGGVDSGGANSYALSFAANFSTLVNGIVIYWVPANTNTGASVINVNGLGVIGITSINGAPLIAGQLVAGQPATIMYYNGFWLLLTGSFVGNTSGVKGYGPTAAGLVDMTPDVGSWTTTLSGPWVAGNNPTGVLKWKKVGGFVSVWTDVTIAQAITLSSSITASGVPAEITPSSQRIALCGGVTSTTQNNSMGVVNITTSNTFVITAMLTANAANPTVVRDAGATNLLSGIGPGWSILYAL